MLLFAVMKAAGNRRKKRKIFGDLEFLHQIARTRLMALQRCQAERRRNLIPCGLDAPRFKSSVSQSEKAFDLVHFPGFGDGLVEEEATPVGWISGAFNAAQRVEKCRA